MSQSTDAILAFGFNLTDEDEDIKEIFGVDEEDEFEFDEWLATMAGAIYPAGHAGIDSPAYVAYSNACKAAVAACPVELVTHCSAEYPMYFLAVRGTVTTAKRGYPEAVFTYVPEQERIDAARAFCIEMGIELQEPQWHIFSMWG